MNRLAAAMLISSLAACSTDDRCDGSEPGTICTIAGTGEEGFDDGEGTDALAAPMYTPFDIELTPDGRELWLIDFNNFRVRALDLAAGTVTTRVGSGQLGDDADIYAPQAELNHLTDIAFAGDYVYLAAWHNSRVKRVDLRNGLLQNFAGTGKRTQYSGDGGPALDAAFDLPAALALAPDGSVVIMDQGNQVLRRVDANGIVHHLAGQCIIADYGTSCVTPVQCPGSQKLTCGDPATTCSASCSQGFTPDGVTAHDLRMAQPMGALTMPSGRVIYDADGTLLFADTDNHRVRAIAPDGTVSTIAEMNKPVALAIGEDGTLYVSDIEQNCIRAIERTTGALSTVAGRCGLDGAFAGDGGPATDARLDQPYGIAVRGDQLYIADSYNHRVRVVKLR